MSGEVSITKEGQIDNLFILEEGVPDHIAYTSTLFKYSQPRLS